MNSLVKPVTWILGIVLTLVGIAGFFMASPLLGFFQVDTLHNIIHLVSGLAGLWAVSAGHSASKQYLIIFGLIYALVTILGFTMAGNILGMIMVNQADNYLHLGIAAVSLIVGFGG